MSRIIGYARVSAEDQNLDLQKSPSKNMPRNKDSNSSYTLKKSLHAKRIVPSCNTHLKLRQKEIALSSTNSIA